MEPQSWDAESMLLIYIYDYMVRSNYHEAARIFREEADVPVVQEVAINDSPGGFLLDWFNILHDMFATRSNVLPPEAVNKATSSIPQTTPSMPNQQEQCQQAFGCGSSSQQSLGHAHRRRPCMILPREPPPLHLSGSPFVANFLMRRDRENALKPNFPMCMQHEVQFRGMSRTCPSDPSAILLRHWQCVDMQRPQQMTTNPMFANREHQILSPFLLPEDQASQLQSPCCAQPEQRQLRGLQEPVLRDRSTNGASIDTVLATLLSHGLSDSTKQIPFPRCSQLFSSSSETDPGMARVPPYHQAAVTRNQRPCPQPECSTSFGDIAGPSDIAPPSPGVAATFTPTAMALLGSHNILNTEIPHGADGNGELVHASKPLDDLVDLNQVLLDDQVETFLIGDADGNKRVRPSSTPKENSPDGDEDDNTDRKRVQTLEISRYGALYP